MTFAQIEESGTLPGLKLVSGFFLFTYPDDPNGHVTAQGKGDLCDDTGTPALWIAPGAGTVWTNLSAGGGGGVASLSGTGVTVSPGQLIQSGGLLVNDAEADGFQVLTTGVAQITSSANGATIDLEVTSADTPGIILFNAGGNGAVVVGGNPVGTAPLTGPAANPPTLPLTVTMGVNDTFAYTPELTAVPEIFTVAPGVYVTLLDLEAALGGAIGATYGETFNAANGANATWADDGVHLSCSKNGPAANGDELSPGPTDIFFTDLGFTVDAVFTGGGLGDQLSFFGAVGSPQNQLSVTGALSTVADPSAKAVLTSILAALSVAAGYGLVVDATT